MRHRIGQGVAFTGRRVRQKICLALVVSSAIPVLVLAYALYARVLPLIDPARHSSEIVWIQALLVFTGLLTAAGAVVIWDLAAAVTQTAELVSTAKQVEAAATGRTDEIGTLMQSFSQMLGTIEQQAAEINQFARRLETAYAELELTNARLKEFSFKDEVSGLYNRRFFSVRLEEEVSRYRRFNHPVSVVLLDLDGFKDVNDELGHAAGDDALRAVAEILLEHSRGINVICRYGGDEFAVLLVETSKAGARIYCERIRRLLGAHVFPQDRRLTASFGIASVPEDVAPGTDDLIRAADEALYAAKRAGKNRVCVYEDVAGPALAQSEPQAV